MRQKVIVYEEKSKLTNKSSLILHITVNGRRIKRSLGLYFKTNPTSLGDKSERSEKLLLAARIANEEERKLFNGRYEFEEQHDLTRDFVAYAENFISHHPVKEKKKYSCALKKLKEHFGKNRIACFELTHASLTEFYQSLERDLNGETPHNYFSKLKQIINTACDENYFRKNPAAKVKIRQCKYIEKEVLTQEELTKLYITPISNESVRNAFLLANYTGLRWVDIKGLTWRSVTNDSIKLIQSKTKVPVVIPLHESANRFLGKRGNPDDKVYDLPSHTGTLKWLRIWTKSAGVEKHITFHCGRHSYGTALIANGVDVSIASKLLGHTSLVNTQRYVRISDSLKQNAISKLPTIR